MSKNSKKAIVIGSGVAGLAVAIRLAKKGYNTTVLEQNEYLGGKLHTFTNNDYRFDTGPSLFTLPHLVDELQTLVDPSQKFQYTKLHSPCTYFYPNSFNYTATSNKFEFATHFAKAFNEDPKKVQQFLNKIKKNYEITSPVFLESSLHKIKTYIKRSGIWGILNLWRLNIFTTMHVQLKKYFTNPQAIQYFNRYATYNGSNPYSAPATLTVIPNIEIEFGAFFPKGGMHSINTRLVELAKKAGVNFITNTKVTNIQTLKNKVELVKTNSAEYKCDIVCSAIDVKLTYSLLNTKLPFKLKKAENSSSALIFYWGIHKEFPKLDVHNILFTSNYEKEFEHLFKTKTITNDPTVYINISSKIEKADAPKGCENWFVMINTPANYGQNWDDLIFNARKNIIEKINTTLQVNIEDYIEMEEMLSPIEIEAKTGSNKGSIYGSSSNSIMSAFFRQANKSKIKGMYFCGGSVHPGGGIPLCLYSAKIVANLIPDIK